MKILHFGFILYIPQEIVKGLREIGEDADHGIWDFCDHEWLSVKTDYNLNLFHIMETISPFERAMGKFVGRWNRCDATETIDHVHISTIQNYRCLKMFIRALFRYKVIHFHSIPSFFLHQSKFQQILEFSLFRLFRKKVFISFWGCDIRREKDDIVHTWSPCLVCSEDLRKTCNESDKTTKFEYCQKLCKNIFSNGDLCVSFPDIIWMDNPIDIQNRKPLAMEEIPAEYRFRHDEKIYIYHSFGCDLKRKDVKGSEYIVESVDSLKRDGYNVELKYFNSIPNNVLSYYQNQADIVVDQLKGGYYGQTAIECMAVGKPVVCYIREDVRKICPHEDLPLVDANPTTIKDVLRRLVESSDLRKKIGNESRKFALAVHNRTIVAKRLLNYYKR